MTKVETQSHLTGELARHSLRPFSDLGISSVVVKALPMNMRRPSYPSPNTPTSSTGWPFPGVKRETGMIRHPLKTLPTVCQVRKKNMRSMNLWPLSMGMLARWEESFLEYSPGLRRAIWGIHPEQVIQVYKEMDMKGIVELSVLIPELGQPRGPYQKNGQSNLYLPERFTIDRRKGHQEHRKHRNQAEEPAQPTAFLLTSL